MIMVFNIETILFYFLVTIFNTAYIDLKMLVGKHRVIRPAGFKSVHWKIQISANQKVNYAW